MKQTIKQASKRKLHALIGIVMSAIFSVATNPAFSGTISCSGKILTLAYHANNSLMIRLDSMNQLVFICSPDGDWVVPGTTYHTGPETCKAIYSTLLTAKATGATISDMYFDGNDVPTACNTWGTWKAANIRYYNY